jgi:hypothetical protein
VTDINVRACKIAMTGIRAACASRGVSGRLLISVTFYLTVTFCNVPAALVARAYGCTRQNVAKSLKHIEDRRESAAFDRLLTELENLVAEGGRA